MATIWIVLIAVGSVILGSWLGYQFCMVRYNPKALLEMMSIQNKAIMGELTPTESLKELEKFKKDFPEIGK